MDYEYSKKPKLTVEQKEDRKQIKEINSLLECSTFRHYTTTTPSAATVAEYERKIKLIKATNQKPYEYCTARNLSAKTYQTMRAAYKYKWVKLMQQYRDNKDPKMIKSLNQATRKFIADDARPYKQQKNQTQERRARESGKISKRRTLKGLPSDWRDQVQTQLANSKYEAAAVILHLTGCRPAELAKGVSVTAHNNEVNVFIRGSKQSEINKSGQSTRMIVFPADSDEARALTPLMQGTRGVVKIDNPNSFQKIYKAAAIRALGRKGKRLTPYSARHQFSADLKKNGYNKVQIAAAMGHQSTRSQGQYGTAQQGGGGGSGMKAAARQQIRTPSRSINMSQSSGMRM